MKRYISTIAVLAAIGFMFYPLAAQEAEEKESYDRYVFTESETAFQQHQERRTRFIPAVSTFGSGGIAYYTMPSLSPLSWQLGIGILSFNDVPERQFRGTLVNETALALPLYTGFRYDFYRSNLETLNYSVFTSIIGGPVLGMGIPGGANFSNSMEGAQLRWGAGGQAALGVEVFFSERWAGYVQGGVDAVGFTRQLGAHKGYLGPAIGLGFGRVIGR